jgi:integrase
MAFKLPSHLHRSRSGTLHFRIAIPPDLRQHFTAAEIYRSLRTASVHEAAPVAQTLSIAFKRVFCEIRQQSMSDPKKTSQSPSVDLARLSDLIRFTKRNLKLQDQIEERDNQLVESARQRIQDKTQHERELNLVLKAKAISAPSAPKVKLSTTPLLSETVEDFARFKLVKGAWTPKTEEENLAVYGLFISIVGDKPIGDIDDEIIITYLETLQKLPANIKKSPAYAGKSITEIIALSPPPMAVRTINKHVERVSSLFKWAMSKAKYGITRNPAAGMGLDESSTKKRQPFTTSELSALFGSKEFTTLNFQNPYAYWLMPMGLLTGARLGELAQLYLSDFVELNGVPCLEISDDEEGQRVKNENAKRLVPIHNKLIELGLLRYVEVLRREGQIRLFPELSERRDGFAQAASNWFQRHKKKCGIEGKHTKVFHSFRHTFISALLDDEVPEHAVAQIVGHEANLITGQVYWNARDAAKRKPTVEKYQPPEQVWRLIPKFEDVIILKRRGPKEPR